MTDLPPAVRARSARDVVDYFDVYEPGARAKVLDLMPPESKEVILNTPKSSWIELGHDHHIVDGAMEVFGRERAPDVWRTFLKGHLKSPLFRALFEGMVRLSGLSPHTVAGFAPRAWGTSYRNFGRVEITDKRERSFRMTIADIPEVVFEKYPGYLVTFEGTIAGILHVADVHGTCVARSEPEHRRLVADVSW